jgi:hypothetical protein
MVGGAAVAQHLTTYDPALPAFIETVSPSPLIPPGTPPLFVYPPAPALPPAPAFVVPPGDSSFDGATGLNWYTNGLLVASCPTVLYPPVGVPMPPSPVPAAVLAAIGGPVTGLAISPAAGILWLTSALGIVVGVTPVPAMPIVVLPFPPAIPLLAPITGLEWDSITGTLLEVDAFGTVYQFLPGGAPFAPPLLAPVPLPAMAGDVAIDKTGFVNGAGVRPIYVLAGPAIIYANFAAPAPPVLPSGATPMATGLAFHQYPAAVPPFGVCACPGLGLTQFVTGPMTSGNAAFAFGVGGLPPGTFVVFAFDFVFSPAFPLINGVGCGLGFFLGSPTLISVAGFAGPGGAAVLPLPLLVPPGFGPIYQQSGTLCSTDPVGFVLTPMQQLWVSGF